MSVTPDLDTELQVGFHMSEAEEENPPLNLLPTLFVTQPRTQVAFRTVSANRNIKQDQGQYQHLRDVT